MVTRSEMDANEARDTKRDQDWENYLDALYLGDRVNDVEPGYADFDPLDKDWEYGAGIDRQFFGRSDDGEPYVWERTG